MAPEQRRGGRPAKRLDRRAFVRGLGAAAAAEALAAASRPFKVGYQIYSFGRYFPANWWKGAAAVASVGFKGVEGEYTIAELYEGRESEFEDGMRRLGLTLAALYSSADLENPRSHYENLRKNLHAAAFCKRMGARTLVIGGHEAHRRDDELFTQYARAANEIGKRCLESHGVRFAVHPHLGALVQSREDVSKVMDRTDPRYFFLAPDTGHLAAAGADNVEVFKTYKQRIVHAHLKDWAPPVPPLARGSFAVLGKGVVDFPALLEILATTAYDGWLDVELDSSRTLTPEQVAREARDYVVNRLGVSL
jgi:sugar phosphate isomerase/epimerase